jgi:large subunit ribosomal protein L25
MGRKVRHLRRAGKLPGTVYGKGIESASVTLAADTFAKVYSETGETGLIELQIDKEVRPVLVHSVQKDPVNNVILHVEFHQVDLKEKVHAKVPVELAGEAPAVAQKLGVLLTVLNDIEVEALPAELPEKITVDVSKLAEVDQEVKVGDIAMASGITVLTDAGLTVVKVGPLVTKEAEAQAAAEEAAAAEAAVAAGGEAPAADAKAEEKPAAEAKPAEEKK